MGLSALRYHRHSRPVKSQADFTPNDLHSILSFRVFSDMPFYHDGSIGIGGQKFAIQPAFKYANHKEPGQPPAPFFTLSITNHQALPLLLYYFLTLKCENNIACSLKETSHFQPTCPTSTVVYSNKVLRHFAAAIRARSIGITYS